MDEKVKVLILKMALEVIIDDINNFNFELFFAADKETDKKVREKRKAYFDLEKLLNEIMKSKEEKVDPVFIDNEQQKKLCRDVFHRLITEVDQSIQFKYEDDESIAALGPIKKFLKEYKKNMNKEMYKL